MSMTQPATSLVRGLVDLPFRMLGLRRAPLAITVPSARSTPGQPPVRLRTAGHDVLPEPGAVERDFPHATDRVVVFVPDGADDESSWSRHLDQLGGTYPSRLAGLLDWTPVHLLVDPDRSARELALDVVGEVQRLVDAWPEQVSRIALVGHGSGGLVLRAACGLDAFGGESWLDLVDDVLLLGTPHLAVSPGGPAWGRRLEEELAGITTDDRADPDLPPLPDARYVVVTDGLRLQRSRIGRLVGDVLGWHGRLLARPRKARELFPTATMHHVDTREVSLLNHPDVHRALVDWLA